jgi:hypothetical protein
VDDYFNNLFVLCTENLNLRQVVKDCATLLSQKLPNLPFCGLKIIPKTETETKTQKNCSEQKIIKFR